MMACPSPTAVSSIMAVSGKPTLNRTQTCSPGVNAPNGSDCKAEAMTATRCVSAAIQVLVNPNETFMKFLQMAQVELGRVTVQNDSFTMLEIFDIIRDYIRNRRLFDPKDPTIVHCGQDALGQVFGVNQFTKGDVLNLIHKNSIKSGMPLKTAKSVPRSEEEPVSSTTEADNVRKRHVDVDVEASPCRKKFMFEDCGEKNESQCMEVCAKLTTSSDVAPQQTSYSVFSLHDLRAFAVATMTNVECDSDIETVFSIQSKVTDIVKDSTDDLWFLETDDDDIDEYNAIFGESSDNDVYANELELLSEPDYAAEHSDSDDCASHSRSEDFLIICGSESDLDFFADCEDDGDESDDMSDDDLRGDKWTCSNCDTSNCAIRRFCDFCWTQRPDWLKVKPQEKEQSCNVESSAATTSLPLPVPVHSLPSSVPANNSTVVTGALNVPTSCSITVSECLTSPTNCLTEVTDGLDVTKNCSTVAIDRSTAVVDCTTDFAICGVADTADAESDLVKKTILQTLSAESQPNSGLCVICQAAPKDASIVHGMTGHQACCFDCAKQLKSRRQTCPVCRRHINKVIRNYFV